MGVFNLIFFDVYKLDHYLSLESIDLQLRGRKVKNDFPGDLKKLLSDYKSLLEEYEFAPVFATHGQIYTGEVLFPNNEYYKLSWDVGYAKSVINEYRIQPVRLSVKHLKDRVDPNTLDNANLKKAEVNKDPIIVVAHEMISGHFVIDGNHRVYARHLAGEEAVLGYILNPEHHFHAMLSDIHRILYLIHQSISSIVDYMVGEMSLSELQSYMDSLNGYFDGTMDTARLFFEEQAKKLK